MLADPTPARTDAYAAALAGELAERTQMFEVKTETFGPIRYAGRSTSSTGTSSRSRSPGRSDDSKGRGQKVHALCMWYRATVPHVQIRNVPGPVHRRLQKRAADAGMSLSEYLKGEVERIAATPTRAEMLERLAGLTPVDLPDGAAELVRAARAERDRP